VIGEVVGVEVVGFGVGEGSFVLTLVTN